LKLNIKENLFVNEFVEIEVSCINFELENIQMIAVLVADKTTADSKEFQFKNNIDSVDSQNRTIYINFGEIEQENCTYKVE
jgi:hypothetical protein